MNSKKNKTLRWRKVGDRAYRLGDFVILPTSPHDSSWTVNPVGGNFETLTQAKTAVKWYRKVKL